MFRFAHPAYFLLLVPLAVAAWLLYRRRPRQGLVFSALARVPAAGLSWRAAAATALPSLVIAGLALTIAALARPQTVLSTYHRSADVIAIEMVVDVSGSMEALDLSIQTAAGTRWRTRLDVVKETFGEFIRRRSGDLIGLVTFGGYASTRAPLTSDHDALLHILKGVEIPKAATGADGQIANQEELLTAIGDGLATACARIERAEPKSRIVVLLSDGESNTGVVKPEEAIKIATKLGIKVYTIGVGTTGRAPFRGRDVFGQESIGYAHVTLDEALLRRIAEATGGRYFNVRDPKGLELAMGDIDKLEKTKVERTEYNQYNELYLRWLVPGLGLILAGAGLNMLVSRRLA
jgi:Ca-activated chloride channel family protein